MRHLKLTAILFVVVLVAAAGCGDPETADNQDDNNDENALDNIDEDEDLIPRCEADFWDCEEFVDGADMSINRFNHQSVVLDDEHVLLIGGSEREEEGGARRSDTWEVFNVEEDTVEVEATEFETTRRNPSVVQLPNASVLVVGGEDHRGDRKRSVKHFSPSSHEWTPLPDMNAAYSQAIGLDDGGVLALGIAHSREPNDVVGQTFDVETLEWSSVSSGELFDDSIADFIFAELDDGRILFVYANEAPDMYQEDSIPEEFESLDWTVYFTTVAIYDHESGEVEMVEQLEHESYGGFNYQLVTLDPSGQLLLEVETYDFDDEEEFAMVTDEAFGYLFDPEDESLDLHYEEDASAGVMRTTLPGDQVVFDSPPVLQIHEVPNAWFDFTAIPDGIYYSTMNLLSDCRLFVSGERTYSGEDERGVQTGYCEPVD